MDGSFTLDTGNNAWMLISAVIVLLMTVPGLAFFYAGMVRGKSAINMLMMNFICAGTVGFIWIVYGYSMAFGSDVDGFGAIVSNPFQYFLLNGLSSDSGLGSTVGVPALTSVAFQATFAVITVALITGAIADRIKFGSWVAFTIIWATAVYFPLAHMVWGGGLLSPNGLIASWLSAPIDFAGGTVVHIDAGAAALALILLLGKRVGWPKSISRPHNVPFVMLGSALLWIGWFGFNAGSEGAADATAARAWINTFVATAVALLAWLIAEKIKDGHATGIGAASAIVAGLVAITPAAAAVDTVGAICIGLAAGLICYFAIGLKFKAGYDDALDVIGVHLVGGLTGTILIGFFAVSEGSGIGDAGAWYPLSVADGGTAVYSAQNGLFYGGGFTQLATQTLVALIAFTFSFVITYVIGFIIKKTVGLRLSKEIETGNLDLEVHGETAYETVAVATSHFKEA